MCKIKNTMRNVQVKGSSCLHSSSSAILVGVKNKTKNIHTESDILIYILKLNGSFSASR